MMPSRPYVRSNNARALLVGVSLLFLACSAAEIRQIGAAEQLDPEHALDKAQQVNPVHPARVQQILTGLTLLQMGYAEHEVAQWFAHAERFQLKSFAVHAHLPRAPLNTFFYTPSPNAAWIDLDSRIGLAMIQSALLSGSSPV